MDEDLKTFLVGMQATMVEQIKSSEARMEEHIAEKITASESRLQEHIAEKISDSETRLLTEFWKWGRTADQKLRRTEHNDSISVERISALEDRVFTLERKAAGSPE